MASSVKVPTIQVRNLSFLISSEEFHQMFAPFGQIVESTLFKNKDGLSKGCGIVKFEKSEDASNAFKSIDRTKVKNCVLNLQLELPPKKPASTQSKMTHSKSLTIPSHTKSRDKPNGYNQLKHRNREPSPRSDYRREFSPRYTRDKSPRSHHDTTRKRRREDYDYERHHSYR